MRRPMETVQDLIEEAKVRTVWWGLCIFGITYFLSHTSKSMWMNLPISIIILCVSRYLCYEMELRWKVQPIHRQTYLSHLQKRQLPVNDPRLSALPAFTSWKKKLNSPPIEAAICDFINKVLQDFMVDLWYSSITPDKEAPELIRVLILDAIGTVSGRIKDINLVDLLTRDVVELISNHLDLFRRNQSSIGVEVMGTLSHEQIDERLKHHLMASQELHPALRSAECEYKVLQRLVEGVLATVLEPREAQSPLVRCFSRELLTSLVLEPVMNLASPAYINELIEVLFLASKNDDNNRQVGNAKASTIPASHDHSVSQGSNAQNSQFEARRNLASSHSGDVVLTTGSGETSSVIHQDISQEDPGYSLNIKPAEWARVLDAATERRTQVLAPENLENMWTKGRNYKKKTAKLAKAVSPGNEKITPGIVDNYIQAWAGKEMLTNTQHITTYIKDKQPLPVTHGSHSTTQLSGTVTIPTNASKDGDMMPSSAGVHSTYRSECQLKQVAKSNSNLLKRSSSTSDIKKQHNIDTTLSDKAEEVVSRELYFPKSVNQKDNSRTRADSEPVSLSEGSLHAPKLKCRVVGAYFEKIGSNSFAVYSIAVSDAENMTWFVKRRYRNFERLHRYLKDIPNYTLHLPPKRFLSSSIDDYFVHQRCILLDKYLQDLLSIANIAEQHEVWDFLSASSKNYSFGKSTSVMKTLAVNVDDAMDDIVRQFKGVSIGLRRKVVGSPSTSSHATCAPKAEKNTSLSYNEEDSGKASLSFTNTETPLSLSEDDIHDEEASAALISGWHSDNELNLRSFPRRVVKPNSGSRSERTEKLETAGLERYLDSNTLVASDLFEDQIGVPPEWSPPNVSVPILNLVDNIFQLKQRGWLRQQVFWISKQILQLMMEDAIDDWLLRQINWLRRDDVIAQGIHWLQDVLWPNGIFFMKLDGNQAKTIATPNNQKSGRGIDKVPISFEQQLEAARRASDVKKIILGGAPTTLVSLIGHKQYKRCAKDIYYFLQSTICIKQLAYGMLELLLISLFPELQDVVQDIHRRLRTQPN